MSWHLFTAVAISLGMLGAIAWVVIVFWVLRPP